MNVRIPRVIIVAAAAALTVQSGATTFASAGLRFASEQVVIVPAPMVHVSDIVEDVSVVNPGIRDEDVRFPLPAGAQGVMVGDGHFHTHILTMAGHPELIVTGAAKAGRTSPLSISFKLPFTSITGVTWTMSSSYSTDEAKLYLPIAGFSLSAPDLQAATQTVTISGTRFRVYTRLAVPSGDEWPISVEGLPALTSAAQITGLPMLGQDPTGRANEVQALLNVGIIVFVFLLCLIGIQTGSGLRLGRPSGTPSEVGIEGLYDAWTNLERQYEAGVIAQALYVSRRAKFRDAIVRLEAGSRERQASSERHADSAQEDGF